MSNDCALVLKLSPTLIQRFRSCIQTHTLTTAAGDIRVLRAQRCLLARYVLVLMRLYRPTRGSVVDVRSPLGLLGAYTN